VRSRAAASILARAGFREVYSMEGGIRAWKGLAASGAPEAGVAHFPPDSPPSKLTALAWLLEKGTQKFYGEAASGLQDSGAARLFAELAAAEERHKGTLYRIHLEIAGAADDPQFPESLFPASAAPEYMEGGVEVAKALEWTRGKSPAEVLEFALALEVNAYDLHLKMEQRMADPRAKKMFARIADEEKEHLSRLQEHFIRLMTPG
jgi:sulfur-carrier protein adenylyltransferase/sulfurtransferase